MHRTEGADFISVGGENFFQDGPPGTIVTSSWLNAVQEEIINILEEASVTPQTAATETRDQLIAALKILFVEPDAVETLTNKTINSDSNTITIDGDDPSTSVINTTASSITEQNADLELKIDAIPIGDWDMQSTPQIGVPFTHTYNKVVSYSCVIYTDPPLTAVYQIGRTTSNTAPATPFAQGSIFYTASSGFLITAFVGGDFDTTDFNQTGGFNRGYIYVVYYD